MNKKVIFRRKKSILSSIDEFLSSNLAQFRTQHDEESLRHLICKFQLVLANEKNSWSQFVLKEIEDKKEDLKKNKDDIKIYRKEKANLLNQLIIKNRKLKRSIQENYERKNKILDKKLDQMNDSPNNLFHFEQLNQIETSKKQLLAIYMKIRKIKPYDLNFLCIEIDNINKLMKKEFYQIQNSIYEYQNSIMMKNKEEKLEKFKETQNYYLTEINKLQQFNESVFSSLNSICSEYEISQIESLSKEIRNKSLSVGEEAIYKELAKIYPIRKRIKIKYCAKIIVDYIVKSLYEKDKIIINNLKQIENSIAILKEKIRRIEIKSQYMLFESGSFLPNIFNQEQSEIAKNIHDIKLMQRNFFE